MMYNNQQAAMANNAATTPGKKAGAKRKNTQQATTPNSNISGPGRPNKQPAFMSNGMPQQNGMPPHYQVNISITLIN
jgi:hypothetical protein